MYHYENGAIPPKKRPGQANQLFLPNWEVLSFWFHIHHEVTWVHSHLQYKLKGALSWRVFVKYSQVIYVWNAFFFRFARSRALQTSSSVCASNGSTLYLGMLAWWPILFLVIFCHFWAVWCSGRPDCTLEEDWVLGDHSNCRTQISQAYLAYVHLFYLINLDHNFKKYNLHRRWWSIPIGAQPS